ncbi:SET domain-protein 5 [Podospora aff. communis PSN243]|uniref:SET domain-protein 5 n=1 Tax=Podospora aff. communis PSN243 TaxID=3040156 RepID=A0AAV9G683_9PEZI|nr:SET domain-protein 5 [Podospora aff. communis PSN243]
MAPSRYTHLPSFMSLLVPSLAIQRQCNSLALSPLLPFEGGICLPPIDDLTEADGEKGANYSPWTETPYCLYPRSIGSKQKFCVYTSSVFNNNAGISIVTTPEAAASLANAAGNFLPAWRNRGHLAHGGELTAEQEAGLPYKVVAMPGKGKGVIATRRIAQFEHIMVSYAAMIVDNEFIPREGDGEQEGDPAPVESWRLFQRALDQLTDKARFHNLATSRGKDVHVVEDVCRTNAFGLTIMDRKLKGLYPEISRFNHGCDPNAFPQYRSRDLSMTAVATRDIEPGEEITISYLPLGMPSHHRRRNLFNWGFNCTCSLCTASPAVQHESDQRRERLADLYFAMKELSVTHKQLLEMTDQFLALIHAEHLETRFGEYFQAIIMFYYNRKDLGSALKYARLSLKYSEAFADPDGGFCQSLRDDIGYLEKLIAMEGETGP